MAEENTEVENKEVTTEADEKVDVLGAQEPEDEAQVPDTESNDESKSDDTQGASTGSDEYQEYGHKGADAAVALLKESNVDAGDAAKWFDKVKETGDINDLDFEAMSKEIGNSKAVLVQAAVKDYYESSKQSFQKTADLVIDVIGGQDNLKTLNEWAESKQDSDPSFATKYAELYKMFDLGETSATLAAKELKSMYDNDPSNSSLNKSIVTGDGVPSGDKQETLNRADYLAKVKIAHSTRDKDEVKRLGAIRYRSM